MATKKSKKRSQRNTRVKRGKHVRKSNSSKRVRKPSRAGGKARRVSKRTGQSRKKSGARKVQRKHGGTTSKRKPTGKSNRRRAGKVGKYPRSWSEIEDLPGIDTPHDYSGDTNGRRGKKR